MRQAGNFIDSFVRFTAGKGSPELYRRWSAIAAISCLLERKVWIRNARGKLYPNQYILLIGSAGIGKSLCTRLVYDLLESVRSADCQFYIAPSSVTKASLIDNLAAAERRIIRPLEFPSIISFNSLSVVVNEFGVFLHSWENEFMATLTDLWDCGRYAETRRTSKINLDIPNTQLNLFSATTPTQLTGLLPEGAWDTGFMARTMMIFSDEFIYTDIFAEEHIDDPLWQKLEADALAIYSMYGEFQVTDDVKEAFNAWARTGGEPIPAHPKLHAYSIRRGTHLLKLCMAIAAARDGERVILLEDYAEALDLLLQTEAFMPDVFKSMKTGGDLRVIEECWHYAYDTYMKMKPDKREPIPEHRIVAFLQERTPVHNIDRLLDTMVRANLLKKQFTSSGTYGYEPVRKAA